MTSHSYDVLIIGSGAAGLSTALDLGPEPSVCVIAKGKLTEGSTYYAQGGISAVLKESDSVASHAADTMDAGAGLCDEATVRFVAEHGREEIERLLGYGVAFTTMRDDHGDVVLHLTREGGHSHRRVVHAADATGKAVEEVLVEQAGHTATVTALENHIAVDLIVQDGRCVGAYVLDEETGTVKTIAAKVVVLATGGVSKVYLYTSNPDTSTGDGIAMAWRAGCRVANMEFTQFHPTCLHHPKAKSFLVTEALRGEGAVLKRPDTGARFMDAYDARAELAPRDIVARAIDNEMKRHGFDYMHLDISHQSAEFIQDHFPTVYARCLGYGFDITKEPIPVVPAAHYTCGGVMTDLHARTDLPGLYAVGEAAYTGLHGANRMASNSLLECLVFAASAAQDIQTALADAPAPPPLKDWDESQVTTSEEEVVVSHDWEELRRVMWNYVGIVRSDKRLAQAQQRVDLLTAEIAEYYGTFRVTGDFLELRNLATCADLIVRSAASRRESRGLHYTKDYPMRDDSCLHPTILTPGDAT